MQEFITDKCRTRKKATDSEFNTLIYRIQRERLNIIKPTAKADAELEIDQFLDWWKVLAAQPKPLLYKGPLYRSANETKNYLMSYYGQQGAKDTEKQTLSSMREVESAANMFYFVED